ncbi:hypothetical protein JOQ06_019266, partial [Pogonophryne albipinna]
EVGRFPVQLFPDSLYLVEHEHNFVRSPLPPSNLNLDPCQGHLGVTGVLVQQHLKLLLQVLHGSSSSKNNFLNLLIS